MQLAFTILNSLGLVGLAVFLYFVFSGFLKRIEGLKSLAEEQKKTLEAVRERAEEFDKLSRACKQALSDFQEMGAKIDARKNSLIKELEDAVAKKDKEAIQTAEHRIARLELEDRSAEERKVAGFTPAWSFGFASKRKFEPSWIGGFLIKRYISFGKRNETPNKTLATGRIFQ